MRCASARTTPAIARAASGRRSGSVATSPLRQADGGADVEVGGQDDVEPARHRIAKARHHHRQRDRQGQARDDAGDGDRRARALMARALDGEEGEGAARLGHAGKREADAAGHAGDAADQQQRDRAVGGERNLEHRRQGREHRAEREQGDADEARRARRRRHAEALERLRRRDALRRSRRQPAADERGDDAEQAVADGARGIEAQRRRDAGEVAAAEVAAEEPQGDRCERGTEGEAEHAADGAEQRRLGEDEAEPLPRRQAEDGEQRERLDALRDREGEDREDQERAGEHRHQREHGEVDAVGARDVRDPVARFARRGGAHAGRQLQRGQRRGAVGARREANVDPAQLADVAERDLRAGDVDDERAAGRRAPTVPAMRSVRRPAAVCSTSVVAAPPRRRSAAALRKTASGSSTDRRCSPDRGRGSSAGATCATTSASRPRRRIGTRAPAASKAKVSASTTGLATATPGAAATVP